MIASVGDINIALESCCISGEIDEINFDSKSCYYKLQVLKRKFDVHNGIVPVFELINKDKLNGLNVIMSSDEIIKLFEYIISKIDEKIYNNHLEVLNLQNTGDTILPKLMSGDVVNISIGKHL